MTPSLLSVAMPDLQASIPWTVALAVVGYAVTRLLYNLFLHPLRHFPGPWWAACSHLHEFYFDVIQRGMFMWEIERMHQKYGELHQLLGTRVLMPTAQAPLSASTLVRFISAIPPSTTRSTRAGADDAIKIPSSPPCSRRPCPWWPRPTMTTIDSDGPS